MEALKLCPFCGNKDVTMWPMKYCDCPFCENCGATIMETVQGEDTEALVKAWNTRVGQYGDKVDE